MQEVYGALDIDGQPAGEIRKISPEAQGNIDEITRAFKAFEKVGALLKEGVPSMSREEYLHKRAKERRAKRKRGGHK